jgi:hypothetical protein
MVGHRPRAFDDLNKRGWSDEMANPVHIGPLETIVNVSWGGKLLVVNVWAAPLPIEFHITGASIPIFPGGTLLAAVLSGSRPLQTYSSEPVGITSDTDLPKARKLKNWRSPGNNVGNYAIFNLNHIKDSDGNLIKEFHFNITAHNIGADAGSFQFATTAAIMKGVKKLEPFNGGGVFYTHLTFTDGTEVLFAGTKVTDFLTNQGYVTDMEFDVLDPIPDQFVTPIATPGNPSTNLLAGHTLTTTVTVDQTDPKNLTVTMTNWS